MIQENLIEDILSSSKEKLRTFAGKYIEGNTFVRSRTLARNFILEQFPLFTTKHPKYAVIIFRLTLKFRDVLDEYYNKGILSIYTKTTRGLLYIKNKMEE